MLPAPQHTHEAGRLLEELAQVRLLRSKRKARVHVACRLCAGTEHARHGSTLVPDRTVGEREVGGLLVAVADGDEGKVPRPRPLSGESRLDERTDTGPDVGPDVWRGGAGR